MSYPETDGQTERTNRIVEDVLRSFATSFNSWGSFLPMVEFAMNNAVHASTGLTPFYANYVLNSRGPALLSVERSYTTNEIDVEDVDGSTPRGPSETLRPTTNGHVPRGSVSASDESRESAHGAMNGVSTRHASYRERSAHTCRRAGGT
ncbi:hypothetical protein PHMEG_00018556 [Phytophthora megakarya]|uniref:Reverse transcriptase n=1 Tax=Phytophthora megakarya TaxID=4795 RepID=A0A225VVL4_9STRA|nr:hypothetical protein PHMEG_00018556 [Phytophthora megakarya]